MKQPSPEKHYKLVRLLIWLLTAVIVLFFIAIATGIFFLTDRFSLPLFLLGITAIIAVAFQTDRRIASRIAK